MKNSIIIIALLIAASLQSPGQSKADEARLRESLQQFFSKYKPSGVHNPSTVKLQEYTANHEMRTLDIHVSESFATQLFSRELVDDIYKSLRKSLPKAFRDYQMQITTGGVTIEELIPNRLRDKADATRMWGDIDYHGQPWVTNASLPYDITQGLQGRHLSLWASHGRYYDLKNGRWTWQRPILFGTCEDLYTQTIVVPYLIPMLENAGAIVFTPRERDWQKAEVIVDNDGPKQNYIEVTARDKWHTTAERGFAFHAGDYADNENPFEAGTARMVKTTTSKSRYALATYQPTFTKAGRYAVYVSYQTLPESVDQVKYTVWHKGERTDFVVNQQMGGGTWVYLGTFDFDAGYSEFNRVTVSNQCSKKGVITTDAVRFGGGMGNIQREGLTSGLPRAVEGARYYAQWAGMPYNIYSMRGGTDDYADDLNVRSLMTNFMGGGSPFMPNSEGKRVPIELSLAIHSDAGFARDGKSMIGSLAICTTKFNDGKLNAGISRMASRDLADALLAGETLDMKFKYGTWTRRELFDRNYSETRLPDVPSSILETMSHQSFPDMRYGQDPNARFTLARSIYKTILRYVAEQHDMPYTVTPLAPDHFRITMKGKDEVRLEWNAVTDAQEASSKPASYVVYTAVGDGDFDNGLAVTKTHCTLKLMPDVTYHFKVAAVNKGGRSFTTEVLSALITKGATQTVYIVNGFHRIASPAVIDNDSLQGFDLQHDAGATYGPTLGWAGRQTNFSKKRMGDLNGGLGSGGHELEGKLIAGNNFDYVRTHAEAIRSAHRYNIVSCSSQAFEEGLVSTKGISMVDLILGLEKADGYSTVEYKSMSYKMQKALRNFTARGGALLVSGAYVGSDMTAPDERTFMADMLKCTFGGTSATGDGSISGMKTSFNYWNTLNEDHYAALTADILTPVHPAFTALQYADGTDAAIAFKGEKYRTFTAGFPIECITDRQKMGAVMRGILSFLMK